MDVDLSHFTAFLTGPGHYSERLRLPNYEIESIEKAGDDRYLLRLKSAVETIDAELQIINEEKIDAIYGNKPWGNERHPDWIAEEKTS